VNQSNASGFLCSSDCVAEREGLTSTAYILPTTLANPALTTNATSHLRPYAHPFYQYRWENK